MRHTTADSVEEFVNQLKLDPNSFRGRERVVFEKLHETAIDA